MYAKDEKNPIKVRRQHGQQWGGLFAIKRKPLVDYSFPELNEKSAVFAMYTIKQKRYKNEIKMGIYVDTETKVYGGKEILYRLNSTGSYKR